jgi:hypothetical protein
MDGYLYGKKMRKIKQNPGKKTEKVDYEKKVGDCFNLIANRPFQRSRWQGNRAKLQLDFDDECQ